MVIRSTFLVVATALCLSGCSPSSDLKRETNIRLCPGAGVQDLTTQQERNTTPGFSYHLRLSLDPTCARDFERQLSSISPRECPIEWLRKNGCTVMDTYAASGKHTTIMAKPISPDKYDVRFYQ
jgi:hypothetical protein